MTCITGFGSGLNSPMAELFAKKSLDVFKAPLLLHPCLSVIESWAMASNHLHPAPMNVMWFTFNIDVGLILMI